MAATAVHNNVREFLFLQTINFCHEEIPEVLVSGQQKKCAVYCLFGRAESFLFWPEYVYFVPLPIEILRAFENIGIAVADIRSVLMHSESGRT